MNVGRLKILLAPLDDGLNIIVIGRVLDADGDDCEAWFALRDVTRALDRDTAEYYARFDCDRIEDGDSH